MGQVQHICLARPATSRSRRLRQRICLRKGCGCAYQPRRWNQRYCQSPECLREVRRWQAAKRQRRRRQKAEHRQRHSDSERQRRKRRREEAQEPSAPVAPEPPPPNPPAKRCEEEGAWSRSKDSPESFCDRPGCYDPVGFGRSAQARYCGDRCACAMRRVLDRERKWLRRNTLAGRFKRQLEYEAARRRRAGKSASAAEP